MQTKLPPLHQAVSQRDEAAIRALLGDPNQPNPEQQALLNSTTAADTKLKDESIHHSGNLTALHLAIKRYDMKTALILLSYQGHDFRIRDNAGATVLLSALRRNSGATSVYEVVKKITEIDPAVINIPDNSGIYPVISLLDTDTEGLFDLEILRLFVETKILDASVRSPRRQLTALHFAVQLVENSIAATKLILAAKADVNAQARNEHTALHFCVGKPDLLAELLLVDGVQVDITNDSKRTPLLTAAKFRYLESFELLMQKQARIDIADEEGKLAVDYVLGWDRNENALRSFCLLLDTGKVNCDKLTFRLLDDRARLFLRELLLRGYGIEQFNVRYERFLGKLNKEQCLALVESEKKFAEANQAVMSLLTKPRTSNFAAFGFANRPVTPSKVNLVKLVQDGNVEALEVHIKDISLEDLRRENLLHRVWEIDDYRRTIYFKKYEAITHLLLKRGLTLQDKDEKQQTVVDVVVCALNSEGAKLFLSLGSSAAEIQESLTKVDPKHNSRPYYCQIANLIKENLNKLRH